MRAAHVRPKEVGGGEGAVKAGELVEAAFADGASPSAAARKTFAFMLAYAAGTAWEDRWHSVSKAQLQQAHQTIARVQDVLDELARTLLRVRVPGDNGDDILTGAVVSDHKISVADGAKAQVQWRFSEAMREVMRRSDHYAELRTQVIAALESRYSVTLYEVGCSYYRRRHPVWSGTVNDVRALLGVPTSYRDWTDVRRRTLSFAQAELDHLAPFNITWRELRRGRMVERIEITFTAKDSFGRVEAEEELRRSRVGRRVRRDDVADRVVDDPGLKMALDAFRQPPLQDG
jgi:plasmid replication initiation protein